jgi:hypothetical protein
MIGNYDDEKSLMYLHGIISNHVSHRRQSLLTECAIARSVEYVLTAIYLIMLMWMAAVTTDTTKVLSAQRTMTISFCVQHAIHAICVFAKLQAKILKLC